MINLSENAKEDLDLGDLCNGLATMGVSEEELKKISSKHGVAMFTRPGTRADFYLDLSGFLLSGIAGGVIGAFVGYMASNNNTGAILGGLIGACAGLCEPDDRGSTERYWMGEELKEKYPNLVRELRIN